MSHGSQPVSFISKYAILTILEMLFTFLKKATISQLLLTRLQAGQTFKSRRRQIIFLESSCPSGACTNLASNPVDTGNFHKHKALKE